MRSIILPLAFRIFLIVRFIGINLVIALNRKIRLDDILNRGIAASGLRPLDAAEEERVLADLNRIKADSVALHFECKRPVLRDVRLTLDFIG